MHYALHALPGFSWLPASTCRELINRRHANGGGTRGGWVSAVGQKDKQPTTCARWWWALAGKRWAMYFGRCGRRLCISGRILRRWKEY
ncbi:hypothetical protein BGZ57DRAFT_126400 [Hyaloscypha finlandica]|nr:hypothetical protein BGZ57DRAFT_126400 [Hyaloscypha finlandica]